MAMSSTDGEATDPRPRTADWADEVTPVPSPGRLPLLGDEPFLVVNGDIWCDWDFAQAPRCTAALGSRLAYLILVDNPGHHAGGDFSLAGDVVCAADGSQPATLTYAGIAVFRPAFFAALPRGTHMKLRPLFDDGIRRGLIAGERYDGSWVDVGTVDRLQQLDRDLTTTP
jgi:MurNAc alpha-1-phosphate uridylyltransferase